jgi:PAS domain S-box-containing protein
MSQSLRVLLVEDSEDDALPILQALRRDGYAPTYERVQNEQAARAALACFDWDVVLCDYVRPGFDAPGVLKVVQESKSDAPVIVVSGTVGEEMAVTAMQLGAADYVLKDRLTRLGSAVAKAIAHRRLVRERKEAEAALTASESQWRLLVEQAADGIFSTDCTGRFLAANQAGCQMLGYSLEELLLLSIHDIHPPEEATNVTAARLAVLTGAPLRREILFRRKDGSTFPGELSAKVLSDGRMQGIVRDISERKRIERALRSLVLGTATGGGDFFASLVRELAACLQVRYAVVGRLVSDKPECIRTLAVWAGDRQAENFDYALEGTPCHNVVGKTICHYASGVAEQFPNDQLLVDMGVQAYLGAPLFAPDGRALGLIAVLHDQVLPLPPMTHDLLHVFVNRAVAELQRQEAEQLLRQSEIKFHALYAGSPLAIVLSTLPEGRIADANPAAETLIGHKLCEVRGRTTTELDGWVDPAARQRYVQLLQSSGAVSGFEAQLRRGDGVIIDVLYHARVIDISGQKYVLNSLLDVTDRRKSEEQVRHLAAFPELNPNPVLEFNASGALVYNNPAAIGMAQKLGSSCVEQLVPVSIRALAVECLATGRPRLRVETKREKCTLSWSFYPIESQQRVHCYVSDITERQSLEEQLRHSQKMEAIGQLAGGVAHDFNNLLTAIIGHVGLLQGNLDVTPEIRESLDEIDKAANRAVGLTKQLLTFSRRGVFTNRALDINEIVKHLSKMLRRLLGEHVNVHLDFSPEPLTFRGDVGMIEQVLVNLAVNARDAMPEGGTLRIATRRCTRASDGTAPTGESEFVHLAVADTGIGIPPELRSKIFEPFFTTKDVGKGTGLGLATVFGIVQQHQGWVEVESEPGCGAAFNVFLPFVVTGPVTDVPESTDPVLRGRNELILLVEDEAAVKEVARRALTRHGYRVLTADNGPMALELWRIHQAEIDLLLTDMVMPEGLSGIELARLLRNDNPKLPVVYASGYNAEITGREVPLVAHTSYLSKPFELSRLFRTLRSALDEMHFRIRAES